MKRILKEKISELKNYGEKPIGVFGARASGKTVFFTSLYALETMQNLRNDIKINCTDWNTKEYLKTNYKYIMKGEFPPRTDANTIHKINMSYVYNNQKYILKSIDFAGELLAGVPNEYRDDPNIANYIKKKQELVFDFFSTCGGILIFLEPTDDTDKALMREKEIKTLLSALQEQDINWRLLPLAVIITKWDKVNPKLNDANTTTETNNAVEYISKHKIYNRIYNTVKLFSGNVKVFPISSSGVAQEESARMLKLTNPFNLFSPLTWIADYRNKIWFDRIKDILQYNLKKTDIELILKNFTTHTNNKTLINELKSLIEQKYKKQFLKTLILVTFGIVFSIIVILFLISKII